MIGKFKEKGITLVALVVTIIIVLILAGVTISQITGDNGLIKRTTQAKEEYEKESIKEEIRLAVLDKRLEKNGELSDSDLEGILKKYGTVEGTGKDIKLTPTGTSYKITYDDIMNDETTSDTEDEGTGSNNEGVTNKELAELKKEIEELKSIKENYNSLQEQYNIMQSKINNLSNLSNFHNVYNVERKNVTNSDYTAAVSYEIPEGSFYCVSVEAFMGKDIPATRVTLRLGDSGTTKAANEGRTGGLATTTCGQMGPEGKIRGEAIWDGSNANGSLEVAVVLEGFYISSESN